EPVAISAEHGQGMAELRDAIAEHAGEAADAAPETAEGAGEGAALPGEDIDPDAEPPAYDAQKPIRIAVAGRPNVGKSTLVNALIGEERMLTGPEGGVTRAGVSVRRPGRGRGKHLVNEAG